MKVNLGCGNSPKAGYVNCDNNPKARADQLLDVTKPLPWGDNSVQEVCCENLWDSLDRREFNSLLREIHRVLVSGGVLSFHQGDVAVNPDMCIGWPGFVSGYTRYLFHYYEAGHSAHENWKDLWDLPTFVDHRIRHNENGIMIGTMRKP